MTEDMKKYLTFVSKSRGLIIVAEWDEYSEKFLSNYQNIVRTRSHRIVKKDNKEFLVIKSSDRLLGKRTNHLILDSRLDDRMVGAHFLPYLVGMTRTVEIF